MKRRQNIPILPVHDYGSAIESAVSWLGERHLLAIPVTSRQPRRRLPALLLQTTPWLQTAMRRR